MLGGFGESEKTVGGFGGPQENIFGQFEGAEEARCSCLEEPKRLVL